MNDPQLSLCLRWKGFRLPKNGSSLEECEDALGGRPAVGRFAIADGASESGFAGVWAQQLVDSFILGIKPKSKLLATARATWLQIVQPQATSWHAEMKFEEGAFATFLGLQVGRSRAGPGWRWSARARGDGCLFHIRNGELLSSFPLQRSSEFDNRPLLLGSRPSLPHKDKLRKSRGDCQLNDRFLLMTDALALWFLSACERGRQPWRVLYKIKSHDDFSSWVRDHRATDELRNDDVTLLRIRACART
jgi:hypothetical protein